jgi:hypothetical protein
MPRRRDLGDIRSLGERALKALQAELTATEERLDDLREQASRWARALSLEPPRRRGRPPGSRNIASKRASQSARQAAAKKRKKVPGRKGPKIDWDAILPQLPKEFSLHQLVGKVPALSRDPRPAYVAIARWIRSSSVKKIGDGRYQRV